MGSLGTHSIVQEHKTKSAGLMISLFQNPGTERGFPEHPAMPMEAGGLNAPFREMDTSSVSI